MNDMTITDTQRVIEISCAQDITVPDDGREYHACDLLYFAGLQKPAAHREGLVESGKKYNIKLLAVVTELPEDLEEKVVDEMEDTEG